MPDEEDDQMTRGQAPPPVSPESDESWLPQEPEHVTLEHDRLQHEYVKIGPRISEQGRVVARRMLAAGHAEAKRKKGHAKLRMLAREQLKAAGEKGGGGRGPSAEQVEDYSMLTFEAEWWGLKTEDIRAEAALVVAQTDLKALLIESNMLIQAGSDRRKEMGADPLLRDPEQVVRNINERSRITRE